MQKKIILINGQKRSGKDFSATLLTELLKEQGNSVEVLSFATPLKQIMCDTLGVGMEEMEEFKNNSADYDMPFMAYPNNQPPVQFGRINFRELLQRFGTEGMKPVFGESVWADITLKMAIESTSDVIIIPDFRFNIESDTMLNSELDIKTLKIKNDDVDGGEDLHASERELDDYLFDYTIDNTGHSEHLGNYLETFINTYLI